jgi:hypothetical protein
VDLVGCDFARYFEFDTARRIDIAFIPSSAEEASLPEMSQKLRESEWDIWLSHPCYRASLGEPSGIFRLSDLARRKRIAPEDIDGVHEDIGGPRGDRLSIQIDAPGWTGFVFDRCDSHFHKREHELARVLQIHLGQLWAEGCQSPSTPGRPYGPGAWRRCRGPPTGRWGNRRVCFHLCSAIGERPLRSVNGKAAYPG